MLWVKVLAIVGIGLLVALGCAPHGGAVQPPPVAAAGHYQVYIDTIQNSGPALAVVKVPGGERTFLPDALLSPDATIEYSVTSSGGSTAVAAVDTATGQQRGRQVVHGAYTLPTPTVSQTPLGLSPKGRYLALTGTGSQSTRFAILDTTLVAPAKQFELKGRWAFDALDEAATSVFLLEYLAGDQGDSYHVRRYDLRANRLDPNVIVDKIDLAKVMNGIGLAGLYTRDGAWHLGVYAQNSGTAYIHALPLAPGMGFAFCVDLPDRGDVVAQMAWTVTATPDGARLFAANDALGEVLALSAPTAANLAPPQITQRATLPKATAMRLPGSIDAQAKELPAQRLALSGDGATLYLATTDGVYAIDAARLSIRAHWQAGTPILSLLLSPDGTSLFGITMRAGVAQLDQVDARSGATVGQVAVPLTIMGMERVRSA